MKFQIKDRFVEAYQWKGVADSIVKLGVPGDDGCNTMELYADSLFKCGCCGVHLKDHGYLPPKFSTGQDEDVVCKDSWVVKYSNGYIQIFSDPEFKKRFEYLEDEID